MFTDTWEFRLTGEPLSLRVTGLKFRMRSLFAPYSPTWQLLTLLAVGWLCVLGFQGQIAEWPSDAALLELLWLGVGGLGGFLTWLVTGGPVQNRSRTGLGTVARPAAGPFTRNDVATMIFLGSLSLLLSALTGMRFGDLPPAYHDEYSYLFEAQTILQGRWSWPSSPQLPELFDQFHILNEGRMASRYYPGTALWLAPWVALGHPYWGQWIAGALSTMLVFMIGRELDDRRTGFIAALLLAMAPGVALFHNLLLAHSATLLALMIFLWGFIHGRRTTSGSSYFISGCGLGAALLCRPATAVGFGAPFGLWCLAVTVQSLRSPHRTTEPPSASQPSSAVNAVDESVLPRTRVLRIWVGYGIPLLMTAAMAITYNSATTGNWRTSPYQLYTDLYTPRHVYGLNNVIRGEQHVGPKTLDDYDRWAENLTPAKANENTLNRLVMSGLWTVGLPLMLTAALLSLPLLAGFDRNWLCIPWAIVGLYAIHWPYWYVGIMGWHYIFESAPLWCLLLGHATTRLFDRWVSDGLGWLRGWWLIGPVLAWSSMYVTIPDVWQARRDRGMDSIAFPRKEHANFRQRVSEIVGPEPALVLIDPAGGNSHLDLVVNDAGLNGHILYGRYRPGKTDLQKVVVAFPHRRVYLASPSTGKVEQVTP